mmetsp:Transcript_31103/g.38413  ORF Transcript_31103/g.38413 Transcript_31103/m.38413 type:complete len:353 (+) Transcript_31103:113-1171(+)
MSSRKFSVRIITYNVLSQTLCRPSHFHKNDPLDLVPETRFQRLLEKLKPEVEKQSVLTLQEVSQKWAGKLHTFFARNNYHFVVRLYGSAFSDYMGVGIAIPLENFTILQTDIQRLSSTITWPRRPEPTGLVSVFRSVYSYFQGTKVWGNEDQDEYDYCKKRYNACISVKLKSKKSNSETDAFWVSTYHMPCAFWNQKIMMIHTALILKQVKKLAGADPLILAGDFNFKPTDCCYELVTTGKCDSSKAEYPSPPVYDPDFNLMTDISSLKSAAVQFRNSEPLFTNYSWPKPWTPNQKDEPFIGCLDYIFISDHFQVNDFSKLYDTVEEAKGPFPNSKEPSDHVLLAATLSIKS